MVGHAVADTTPTPLSIRRELLAVATLVWLPLLVVLAAIVVVTSGSDVTVRQLTQDATTVLDGPFYVGLVSNFGLTLWAAAVTVCLFTASLARAAGTGFRRFLAVSGGFTAILLFDDLALLHDEILPIYAGISGDAYGILYVAFMLGYLFAFRRPILATDWPILFVALVCFGVSTVVDVGSSALGSFFSASTVVLVEDGTKLLGIGTWLAYFVAVARRVLADGPRMTPHATETAPPGL